MCKTAIKRRFNTSMDIFTRIRDRTTHHLAYSSLFLHHN